MFISLAHAQELPAQQIADAPSALGTIPMIIGMFVLFYFLLIRPQQKKINEHKKMVEALRRGDKILTYGGIYATISKVEDDLLQIEIAPDVKVKLDKSMVSGVVSRTEPADSNAKK